MNRNNGIAAATSAIFLAAATLPGCERKPLDPASDGTYKQLSADTYFIPAPYAVGGEDRFAANLAKFRSEVPGDFVLVPVDSRYPLTDGTLALRRSVPSKGEESNTIQYQLPQGR